MGIREITTVSENIEEKDAVNLDQALSVVGIGIYNIKYTMVLSLFLIGAIVEPIGYAYILPSSKCDLEMTDAVRGFVGSIPYIGIVITSFPWGYLVDTRGRKLPLLCSALAAGTLGVASAFMPNLVSFIIFKFLTSLCIACPAAVPYTFVGELSPLKYRDLMLTVINAMQICGATLVPLLAWGVLPLEFETDFGAYYFKPWRLLVIVNASIFLIAALLLIWGPESPKFLMSQGREQECLKLLQTMYAQNKKRSPDDFPIKRLIHTESSAKEKTSFLGSLKDQSVPLLSPPHLKWMALNSVLMFGVFATLNGLNMWIPDILNRVFSGEAQGTACEVIRQGKNEIVVVDDECNDYIDPLTFMITTVAYSASGVVAIVVSMLVKYIGKKILLVVVFCVVGLFCILVNFIAQKILFAVLLCSIALLGLAIGPINAYAVQLFPTHLRGMAVGLSMMVGRVGSVVGANVAGTLINAVCEATFYLFGGSLVACGLLSLLLPKSQEADTNRRISTRL